MRRLVLLLVMLVSLLAAAVPAQAHTAYWNVTLQTEHTVLTGSYSWTDMACWTTQEVAPGQTRYLRNAGEPDDTTAGAPSPYGGYSGSRHFGLGALVSEPAGFFVHPMWTDIDTGYATRYFEGPNGAKLSTRRVSIENNQAGDAFTEWTAVKIVNTGSNYAYVRANC